MAKKGQKVMQFLDGGKYEAVVADGKMHLFAIPTRDSLN
jgi:hypothetical protein